MKKHLTTELTQMVLRYQKTGRSLEKLTQTIAGIVYSYPRTNLGWDEDDASDFFCSYFPKIRGLVDRFRFTGKPFEAYLSTCIRWQLKTFAARNAARKVQNQMIRHEYCDWYETRTHAAEEVLEDEKPYGSMVRKILRIGKNGVIESKPHSQRLTYLILRNSMQIDDAILHKTANLTGTDEDELLGCVTELRQRLNKKMLIYGNLINRRNRAHVRIQLLHGLLAQETDDDRRAQYVHELTKEQSRFEKITREIGIISLVPTHKDIAEVMDVPKGSVDSGLYYLKNAFGGIGMN